MDTIEEFVASLDDSQVEFFRGWLSQWLDTEIEDGGAYDVAENALNCCLATMDVRRLEVDE